MFCRQDVYFVVRNKIVKKGIWWTSEKMSCNCYYRSFTWNVSSILIRNFLSFAMNTFWNVWMLRMVEMYEIRKLLMGNNFPWKELSQFLCPAIHLPDIQYYLSLYIQLYYIQSEYINISYILLLCQNGMTRKEIVDAIPR